MKYPDFSNDENLVSSEDIASPQTSVTNEPQKTSAGRLVKIQFLSFTCEDITVVMTTSVSANRKLPSQHRARLPFSFTNQSS